jgi:transposase-like protein
MPTAGNDYPGSYAELRAWFDEDRKCLDYLDWLRWPDGFVCPKCGSTLGRHMPDGRWRCSGCTRRISVTAGTIFDHTRTPLTVWFSVAWHLCSSKVGLSATQLQREMQLGSYQTAWAMLHRYRSVMVRPGRDRLSGEVEVDESFLGGPEPGMPGRGALGKVLFGGAVERVGEGFGRVRGLVCWTAPTPPICATSYWPTSNPVRGSSPTGGAPTRRRPETSTSTTRPQSLALGSRRTRSSQGCTESSRWSSGG